MKTIRELSAFGGNQKPKKVEGFPESFKVSNSLSRNYFTDKKPIHQEARRNCQKRPCFCKWKIQKVCFERKY